MRLKALIFGLGTQSDRLEVERRAYNYVFAEAGLTWNWSAAKFASLLDQSDGGDVLGTYVRTELPQWCQSDDLAHMLRAARRRHRSVCSEFYSGGACRDLDVGFIISRAIECGIRVAALSTSPDVSYGWMAPGVVVARDYGAAIAALKQPASAVLAIEADGSAGAAEARGLAVIETWHLKALRISDDVIATLHSAHDGMPVSRVAASDRREISVIA